MASGVTEWTRRKLHLLGLLAFLGLTAWGGIPKRLWALEPPALPVRVSRGFFETSLEGNVQFADISERVSVHWQEFEPTDPAPDPSHGAVIGDFRDHLGCVSFEGELSFQLCFNLMGDVSNVGLNSREMTLRGPEGWVFRWVRASRSSGGPGVASSFTVVYQAENVAGHPGPAQLELTVRQAIPAK